MRRPKLKRCPFCGEKPTWRGPWLAFPSIGPVYSIRCDNDDCDLRPLTAWLRLRDAAEKWNWRVEA